MWEREAGSSDYAGLASWAQESCVSLQTDEKLLGSSNREETMTSFAFENNYFGYTVKSRAGKGVGRMMTGVCSHPGKRGADGICQGGVH